METLLLQSESKKDMKMLAGLAKKIGLKAKRRIEFYTSIIDCRLMEFELYEGSRRQPREEEI